MDISGLLAGSLGYSKNTIFPLKVQQNFADKTQGRDSVAPLCDA
jgi:hypothetical protein